MTEIIDGLQAGVLNGVQMSPWPLTVVYFEEAPTLTYTNGIVGITLAVRANVPGPNETVLNVASVVAYLKCNIPAAVALRNAIDSALLLATPAAQSEGKAN